MRIGEEVSERLEAIPEQIWVERTIIPKYACHGCEGSGDEECPAVRVADAPPAIIPGSISSPSLLSFVFTNKFCDHLPYYCQEVRFTRIEIECSRQNISGWQQKVFVFCVVLFALMKAHMKTGPVLRMDETTVQVLHEPDREARQKSYRWLARGGPPEKPVVRYEYHQTRAAENIKGFLENFSGFLQTEGYEAYETVLKLFPEITHNGCTLRVCSRMRFRYLALASGGTRSGNRRRRLIPYALAPVTERGKPYRRRNHHDHRAGVVENSRILAGREETTIFIPLYDVKDDLYYYRHSERVPQ